MKNLKKVMLSLLVALGAIGMNAQDFSYGIKSGLNFSVQSEINYEQKGSSYRHKTVYVFIMTSLLFCVKREYAIDRSRI